MGDSYCIFYVKVFVPSSSSTSDKKEHISTPNVKKTPFLLKSYMGQLSALFASLSGPDGRRRSRRDFHPK
jgi:hypothetical protein